VSFALHATESAADSMAIILAEAMARSNAERGAVVSLRGESARVEAAVPDSAWLRSVDLYIARAILKRSDARDEPQFSARDRAYIRLQPAAGLPSSSWP
jgi:hypothetical protein